MEGQNNFVQIDSLPSMMDPIFLNINLPPQGNSTGSSNAIIGNSSPSMNHINGLPQESKLATYISNRRLPSQAALTQSAQSQVGPTVQSSSHSSTIGIGQSNLQNAQVHTVTKSLAALGLDPTSPRKPSVTSLTEFSGLSNSGVASSLSHSASTPSFQQSYGVPPAASLPSQTTPLQYPMVHSTPSTTSPQRVHSPTHASPIRGVSAPPSGQRNSSNAAEASSTSASALSICQENVGGTTYFYTAQDINYASSNPTPSATPSLVFPPYHILPPTPAHVHHMRAPTHAPHFFMGDDLRHDILERQALAMAHVDQEQFPDLPQEVDMYHELVPLEPPNPSHKSSMFGYATSVYKATNMKTGLHYCLYRVHGYRLNNLKVTQIVDVWKKLQHSSLVQLREVFTTKAFSDNSIVFVLDYHPGAETLATRHFSPAGLSSTGWERLTGSLTAPSGASNSFSAGNEDQARTAFSRNMLPESTLWNYIIQLTGAIRAIHTQGLACRNLDPSKILLTDNKSRIRINCCGILDVLNFDPNASNPLAGVLKYQQDDLVNLGKLMVALACSSYMALQRDNITVAIDLIYSQYSRDLAMFLVCLLQAQRVKSINDVMPMIGARFYTALESATQRGDIYEAELGKELHNGRILRLLTKLNVIVDRAQLNLDSGWSETGDRYMLKLFRDYIFHQQTEEGQPWLDLGHVVTVLNKLDCGSPDKICLMSHSEQNVLVSSYAELKRCFERSFQELLQAASSQKSS